MFLHKFSHCFHCHFPWTTSINLCHLCFHQLSQQTIHRQNSHQNKKTSNGPIFSGPYRHFWFRELQSIPSFDHSFMNQVKGHNRPQFYRELIQFYIQHIGHEIFQNSWDWVIYPSRGGEVRDHAHGLAHAWSEVLGTKIMPVVLANKKVKQARQKLGARKKIQFIKLSKTVKGRVLFVDDILTTGSSAKAARKAVSSLEIFAIWTVFYRPSLFPKNPIGSL